MLSATWKPLAALWALPAAMAVVGIAGSWPGLTALATGLLAGLALSDSI